MAKVHVDYCPLCHSRALTPWFSVRDHQVSQDYFMLVRCDACTFVLTQDHPDAIESGAYYASEDYVSHSDNRHGLINRLYHTVRSWMLKRKYRLVSQLVSGKKLLDYGCGTGYFLHTMQQAGWEVTGMEVSNAAAEVARKKFGLKVLPVDNLPKYQQSFHVITLWHVLEHVHTLVEALHHLHQALQDGGYLILALPNHHSLDAETYLEYWGGYDVPRHLWHFRADTVLRATKNLFKLQSMHTLPFDAFYVSMLSEKYQGSGWLGLWRAFWIGFRSWLAGLREVTRSSSIVYILKKI